MTVRDLPTPALLVGLAGFESNVSAIGTLWPGRSLRPHVKAFKSTQLARRLAMTGHDAFCCATVREMEGMARAGLGRDLLLANEVVDLEQTRRLAALVESTGARVTTAVDSPETIDATASGGVREVLIDVKVGMPRCGCDASEAGRLADRARERGLGVRGVMGYEGQLMSVGDRAEREAGTEQSMATLLRAHHDVGGDIISGGGTGTWDCNRWVTELQAGSFTLMDTAYDKLGLPFGRALAVLGRVISISRSGPTYAVADVGLKSLGMDHGNPSIDDMNVWFCSDEHITFSANDGAVLPTVGDNVLVWPAHVDPTVAMHERMQIVSTLAGGVTSAAEREVIDC